MSSASYEKMMADKKRIEAQTDAEFAFAEVLESQGVDCCQFMKQWKLTSHQFNVLVHYLRGVNNEEPVLPPVLKALLFALEAKRAA